MPLGDVNFFRKLKVGRFNFTRVETSQDVLKLIVFSFGFAMFNLTPDLEANCL